MQHQQSAASGASDPKRPFGGLVPSQPKGTRAYQDAASYNQHLNQHQAYTAHQAAAQNAPSYRNPYITPGQSQQSQQQQQHHQQQLATSTYSGITDGSNAYSQHQNPQYAPGQGGQNQHRLVHQTSSGQLGYSSSGHIQGLATNPTVHLNPPVPSNAYNPGVHARARANTINHNNQMKDIPPALARLQRMDNIPRDALTPVLNRDVDAMKEWERRQAGKTSQVSTSYPQIEYLQQQAEMAAASGGSLTWSGTQGNSAGMVAGGPRYPAPPSKLSHSFHPQAIMVDDDTGRREVVMSNVRNAAGTGAGPGGSGTSGGGVFGGGPAVISNPPQVYASNATTSGNRYATYAQSQPQPQQQQQQQAQQPQQQQQQQQGGSGFDTLDRRTDMGNMFVPMQPDQYQQAYTSPTAPTRAHVPSQAVASSFYSAGVVPSGSQGSQQQQQQQQQQQRNPFAVPEGLQPMGGAKHLRGSGGNVGGAGGSMDPWPR